MLTWVRSYFVGRRRERTRSTIESNVTHLEAVYQRRFNDSDRDRFMRLWCEIAEVLEVPVDVLHEDAEIKEYFSSVRGRWWRTSRQDDLEYLIMAESRRQPPPSHELKTIADVLDYLLN
jgi:hypothetical protein